jgi:hypothetical protein
MQDREVATACLAGGARRAGVENLFPGMNRVRRQTPQGEAAIQLIVEPQEIKPGETITLRLVNRGEVNLLTGLPFSVQRRAGKEWVAVPWPNDSLFPLVGIPCLLAEAPSRNAGLSMAWTCNQVSIESRSPPGTRIPSMLIPTCSSRPTPASASERVDMVARVAHL